MFGKLVSPRLDDQGVTIEGEELEQRED